MITILFEDYKVYSQDSYNKMIESVSIKSLPCSCESGGDLIKYGFYTRKLWYNHELIDFTIQRVRCKHCQRTHAILPIQFIPYSKINFDDIFKVITVFLTSTRNKYSLQSYTNIMDNNLLMNTDHINYIIKRFKRHWSERLLTYNILLDHNLICNCFMYYSRQFMQIKRGINLLYCINNTT